MSDKQDRIEVHVVLEGDGVSEFRNMVGMFVGVLVDPAITPVQSIGDLQDDVASEDRVYDDVGGEVCPECGFLAVFVDGELSVDSHKIDCSLFTGEKS